MRKCPLAGHAPSLLLSLIKTLLMKSHPWTSLRVGAPLRRLNRQLVGQPRLGLLLSPSLNKRPPMAVLKRKMKSRCSQPLVRQPGNPLIRLPNVPLNSPEMAWTKRKTTRRKRPTTPLLLPEKKWTTLLHP